MATGMQTLNDPSDMISALNLGAFLSRVAFVCAHLLGRVAKVQGCGSHGSGSSSRKVQLQCSIFTDTLGSAMTELRELPVILTAIALNFPALDPALAQPPMGLIDALLTISRPRYVDGWSESYTSHAARRLTCHFFFCLLELSLICGWCI